MPNMSSYTYMHNHKALNKKPNEMEINNFNWRNKDNCPLANSWQTKYVVYQANIDCDIATYKQKCYLGSCETTFKDNTEPSKELLEIEKRNGTQKIANFPQFICFNCYLAVRNLGHSWGSSLINLMLITAFVQFRPEGHREPHNEIGPFSLAERLVGFELETFEF